MATHRKVSEAAKQMISREAHFLGAAPRRPEEDRIRLFAKSMAECVGDDPLSNVRAYVGCIRAGTTPPPNVLIFLCERLARYLDGAGNIGLATAMGLKPIQKASTPFEVAKSAKKKGDLFSQIWEIRKDAQDKSERKPSVPDAAKTAISAMPDAGYAPSTIANEYKKLRIEKIFDEAWLVLKNTIGNNEPQLGYLEQVLRQKYPDLDGENK